MLSKPPLQDNWCFDNIIDIHTAGTAQNTNAQLEIHSKLPSNPSNDSTIKLPSILST